jgi:hypothetical protein
MVIIKAEFDGRVFVPAEEVKLPLGTKVEVVIHALPRKPTAQDNAKWQDILKQLDASQPPFPTVAEAIRATRKRP